MIALAQRARVWLSHCALVALIAASGCAVFEPRPDTDTPDLFAETAAAIDADEITFDGDGSSFEDPIAVIGAEGSAQGVAAEYVYLGRRLANEDPAWQRVRQRLVSHEKRMFDIVTVRLSDGRERDYYFDVGDFYGGVTPRDAAVPE